MARYTTLPPEIRTRILYLVLEFGEKDVQTRAAALRRVSPLFLADVEHAKRTLVRQWQNEVTDILAGLEKQGRSEKRLVESTSNTRRYLSNPASTNNGAFMLVRGRILADLAADESTLGALETLRVSIKAISGP